MEMPMTPPEEMRSRLGDVLITHELAGRERRLSDPEREIEAYCRLAEDVVHQPNEVLQRIAPLACDLCAAGSAGISVPASDVEGDALLSWSAVAGTLAGQENASAERGASPEGLCLELREPVLLREPGRVFAHLNGLPAPIVEMLVVPIGEGSRPPVGALWVAAHGGEAAFDGRVLDVLRRLAHFTALALHITDELNQRALLMREMNHRVKNSLQLVTSLLSLQSKRASRPTKRQLEVAAQRIRSIAQVHDLLHRGHQLRSVELRAYFEALCSDLEALEPEGGKGGSKGGPDGGPRTGHRIELEADELQVPTEQAVALGIIVNELVVNAIKHGLASARDGLIQVRLQKLPEEVLRLEVTDRGRGLPADFSATASKGVGMHLVMAMATQLRATFRAVPKEAGAAFELTFPYRKL
jgi:two-component sensor histidine kinase